jgi:hypothetical protein
MVRSCSSIVVLLAAFATHGLAQPAITFSAGAVDLGGFSPGGRVAWLSIAREVNDNWVTRVVRREGLVQTDSKGGFSLPFDGARSSNSGWMAVDLASGAVAFGTPQGTHWRQVEPSARADSTGSSGVAHFLQDDRRFLELMLVGQEGAWGLSVGDGGASDEDARPDGTIRAALRALRPIADSGAAPNSPRAGDVIVAFDPDRLEAYSLRVGKPL